MREVRPFWGTSEWEKVLSEAWAKAEAISIDYGVMERAEKVDVGDWQAVWEVLPKDDAAVAALGEHFGEDTFNSLVWAMDGKPVVTLGVKGVVIVDTPEALLVAALDRAEEVRDLLRRLPFKPASHW
ncbi:MAG: hypothetical protein ACP5PX_07545 [Candidatus Hadarchaeum sp.]